jgi:hypothetical protein
MVSLLEGSAQSSLSDLTAFELRSTEWCVAAIVGRWQFFLGFGRNSKRG